MAETIDIKALAEKRKSQDDGLKALKAEQAKKRQEAKDAQDVDLKDFYKQLEEFKNTDHMTEEWENFKLDGNNYHAIAFRYLPKTIRESSLILDDIAIDSFLDSPEDFDNYRFTNAFKIIQVSDDLVEPKYKPGDIVLLSPSKTAGKTPSPEYLAFMNNNNGYNKNPILTGPRYISNASKHLGSSILALPHEFGKKFYDVNRFIINKNDIIGGYKNN